MSRLRLSFGSLPALGLGAALFALGACASPEAPVAAVANTQVAEAAPIAEAPPVEASVAPLAAETPTLLQVADAEDALTLPVSYSCSGGRSFTATFPEHGRAVTVSAAGETRVLQHRGKAEDFIFADGAGATLTAEGAGAALTGVGGSYTECMAG